MLEAEEGVLFDTLAICKYLAHGTGLNGSNRLQSAQIEQELQILQQQIAPSLSLVAGVTYGTSQNVYTDEFNDSLKLIKEYVKTINGKVAGKSWLTGDECTLIDLYIAANLAAAY